MGRGENTVPLPTTRLVIMSNKKSFFRRHFWKWAISIGVIFGSSLIVRNNNTNMVTIVIVSICTTIIVLLIPTLADIIHRLLDDLDLKE